MDRQRRAADQQTSGSQATPALKVVGFHVEGVAASPADGNAKLDQNTSGLASLVGSPNLVIIPPAFQQADSPHARAAAARMEGTSLPRHGYRTGSFGDLQGHMDEQEELETSLLRGHRTTSLPPFGPVEQEEVRKMVESLALEEAGHGPSPEGGGEKPPGPPSDTPNRKPSGAPPPSQSATVSPRAALSPGNFDAGWYSDPGMQPGALPSQQIPGAVQQQGPAEGSGAAKRVAPAAGQLPPSGPTTPAHGKGDQTEGAKKAEPPRASGVGAGPGEAAAQGNEGNKGKAPKGDRGPPPEKKPPLTRAERRIKQEAEKAAKAASKEAEGKGQPVPASRAGSTATSISRQASASDLANVANRLLSRSETGKEKTGKAGVGKAPVQQSSSIKSTELFAHLPQFKEVTLERVMEECEVASKVHPIVLQLGLKYVDGSIKGANARCIALLTTFRHLIQEYTTPERGVLSRDLYTYLNTAVQCLVECRPLSVSMGNAIKFIKLQVSKVDAEMPQEEAKAMLVDKIDTFIQEKIVFADDVLVSIAATKVEDGDVILTYAFSAVVFELLLTAHKAGKKFRVVVADARPHMEGRSMLRMLLRHGVSCVYVLLNGLSFAMPEVTKVLLGAAAVMSNGTVISRVGCAAVAMMASSLEKPVIICCETYKFHERVLLDSVTYNELGNPQAVASVQGSPEITALKGWHEQPCLGLLNLTYDAMPAEYVTVIVTECGAIPATSVPVILREYRQEPVL